MPAIQATFLRNPPGRQLAPLEHNRSERQRIADVITRPTCDRPQHPAIVVANQRAGGRSHRPSSA